MKIALSTSLSASGSTWSPASLSIVKHWYVARGDAVALSSGAVATAIDLGRGAKSITQAVAGQRPAYAASGGVFGALQHWSHVAASDQELAASTAADWKFLHDGTGMAIYMRARPTAAAGQQCLVNTERINSNNVGIGVFWDSSSSGILQLLIANAGGGAYPVNVVTANGSAPINTEFRVRATYKESISPEATLRANGGALVTAAFAAAPSAANPSYPLTIGGRPSAAANDFTGDVQEIIICDAIPTDEEDALLDAWQRRTS